jgi:hypothetical protein
VAEQSQSVWAKVDKELLNTDRDTFLCAVYIRPEASGRKTHEVDSQHAHLEADLQEALADSYHLLICGNLNAQIGSLDEVTDVHFELLATRPHLVLHSWHTLKQKNNTG